MTEHQPVSYTIFCLVFGEDTPFSVTIQPNRTVDALKDAIKSKKQPVLDYLAASSFVLYLITIPDDDDLATNVRQQFNSNPAPKPLKATSRLSTLFPDTPAEETVHIVVQIPKTGK
jgi:Crinkler effector protein N-terminal domain